jgi:hypothetical protein
VSLYNQTQREPTNQLGSGSMAEESPNIHPNLPPITAPATDIFNFAGIMMLFLVLPAIIGQLRSRPKRHNDEND